MFEINNISNNLVLKSEKLELKKILSLNEITENFGLSLTKEQAIYLIQNRNIALKENARIEVGGGILENLIYEFCDSPYIYKDEYLEILENLTNTFYLYRNEFDKNLTDEQIIKYLREKFDTSCYGSIELLASRELENLKSNIEKVIYDI